MPNWSDVEFSRKTLEWIVSMVFGLIESFVRRMEGCHAKGGYCYWRQISTNFRSRSQVIRFLRGGFYSLFIAVGILLLHVIII